MSSKSIAEKLKIKPGNVVWSTNPEHVELIGRLPLDVRVTADLEAASVALVFVDDAAAVRAILATQRDELAAVSLFWIAYRKGNRGDINRDTLWPILGEHDMRPVSQVAIDEIWSAMQFRANRDGEIPFTGERQT
jgi:hypothetical protein